jgi:hypothetical protein
LGGCRGPRFTGTPQILRLRDGAEIHEMRSVRLVAHERPTALGDVDRTLQILGSDLIEQLSRNVMIDIKLMAMNESGDLEVVGGCRCRRRRCASADLVRCLRPVRLGSDHQEGRLRMSGGLVLIIAETDDPHALLAQDRLVREQGRKAVILDMASFPVNQSAYFETGDGGAAELGGVPLADVETVWWRRPMRCTVAAEYYLFDVDFNQTECDHFMRVCSGRRSADGSTTRPTKSWRPGSCGNWRQPEAPAFECRRPWSRTTPTEP